MLCYMTRNNQALPPYDFRIRMPPRLALRYVYCSYAFAYFYMVSIIWLTKLKMMNGRFFAGTQVVAYIADGRERFKKSGASQAAALEDDGVGWEGEQAADEEAKRLDKFGSWLEKEATESKAS